MESRYDYLEAVKTLIIYTAVMVCIILVLLNKAWFAFILFLFCLVVVIAIQAGEGERIYPDDCAIKEEGETHYPDDAGPVCETKDEAD